MHGGVVVQADRQFAQLSDQLLARSALLRCGQHQRTGATERTDFLGDLGEGAEAKNDP
ncbi:hypothetical protein D9M68_935520 [compost metagenome]